MGLSTLSVASVLGLGSVVLDVCVIVPACFNLSIFNPPILFLVILWLSNIEYTLFEFCVLVVLVLGMLPAFLISWFDISLSLSAFRAAGNVADSLQVANLRVLLDRVS